MQWGRIILGAVVCGVLGVLVVRLVSGWSPDGGAGWEPADGGASSSGASGTNDGAGDGAGSGEAGSAEECEKGWRWLSPSDAANAPGGVMVVCPTAESDD